MIKYFEEDKIEFIVLNRPEKRNALHPQMVKDLIERIDSIKDNVNVSSLIITGEGKSFCAGADLEYLYSLKNYSVKENEIDSENLAELFLSIYNFPKPTIAAVNGAAIAGGCGLASVCDFIVANKNDSKFGYSEVRIGFVPAVVSIFLIKKIGEGKAKKLLMSGEIFDAQKAFEIGLVDYLSSDPVEEAKTLAKNLAKNSGYSIQLTKQLVHSVSGMSVSEAVNYCIKLNTISRTSEDFQNSLNNFLLKR